MNSHFDELTEKMREKRQRSPSLEHDDARQSRLALAADVRSDKKTCKRTEDATAGQVKHGDSCSANQADPVSMCLTSFGDDFTGPLALPC